MTEYLVCEVAEVYDKLEDRRKKAAEAKLGEFKVKQHDMRCHEESSDTGTEEMNSEAEVAIRVITRLWKTLVATEQKRRSSGEGMRRGTLMQLSWQQAEIISFQLIYLMYV